MLSDPIWLNALGPIALMAFGATPRRLANRACSSILVIAQSLALLNFILALGWGLAVAELGSLQTKVLGLAGLGLEFYVDRLSATMSILVSFIGLIVIRFSRNYLDGDPKQGAFIVQLCFTLSAVLLIIVSGNLVQLSLAWVATSLGLHSLLIFYPDRPAAHLAARKKFIVSRLGDLCLIGAMIALYRSAGTLETTALLEHARSWAESGSPPAAAQWAGALLAAAALLKSAQFPTHGWLLEVMETPTPVSALLHAGIINAGGFLVLRYADVVLLSSAGMHGLAVIGGFTALFGSAVMLTQTSVKVSLAYSTIAQMGFMLLECGLGAFTAAFLHIVAHSLYKAHAFLSSGSVIDIFRASWSPSSGGRPHPWRLAAAILLVGGAAVLIGSSLGVTAQAKPGVLVLTLILLLGLVQLIGSSIDAQPSAYVLARGAGTAVLVAGAYFALQNAVELFLAGSVPPVQPARSSFEYALGGLIVSSFAALTVLQSALSARPGKGNWAALHPHLANGLYVNTVMNRWVTRFWPAGSHPSFNAASHSMRFHGDQS